MIIIIMMMIVIIHRITKCKDRLPKHKLKGVCSNECVVVELKYNMYQFQADYLSRAYLHYSCLG